MHNKHQIWSIWKERFADDDPDDWGLHCQIGDDPVKYREGVQVEQVLLQRFYADCWEDAMQIYYDRQGFGRYHSRCGHKGHIGDRMLVTWTDDDAVCQRCLDRIKGRRHAFVKVKKRN